jgi:uncharacterized membrane protein
MGPVQVLVVGFDHPAFSGEVLAEFARLRSAGIVRLVDLLVVSRAEDGSLETTSPSDAATAEFGALAAELLKAGSDGASGLGTDGATAAAAADPPEVMWSLEDAVPPGSAAAVALIEHLWAAPLTAAIERAGGRPLEETWLGPEDRRELDRLLHARASGTT